MKENDKTSLRAEWMRNLVAMVNQTPALKQAWQRKKEKTIQNPEFSYPEHLGCETIDMGCFKMEFLTWRDSDNPYVILQLHGGGYMSGLQNQYRRMAGFYAEISKGASVLSVDYRLAPKYPFPAALEDAMLAYYWLREHGYAPDKIVVAGDSAGGGLAMALCMELRTKGETLPAGLVAMSPWTDLAICGDSYTANREIDPVFGADGGGEMLLHSPYIGNYDAKNPLISPLYGDFYGFPPMLIQVGTHEMLYDDAAGVAKKAKKQGVPVRFRVYEGMFHVFQMSGTVIPESKRAWEEVGAFLSMLQRGNEKL